MLISMQNYKKSYDNADYIGTEMSVIRILYLIGELSRRCKYYEEAITLKGCFTSKTFLEIGLVEKTHEQWQLTR